MSQRVSPSSEGDRDRHLASVNTTSYSRQRCWGGLDELERHATPAAREPGPLGHEEFLAAASAVPAAGAHVGHAGKAW